MKWHVDNYKDWYNRNMDIKNIMEENRKQIEKLEFENSCFFYLLTTLKNIGWKED